MHCNDNRLLGWKTVLAETDCKALPLASRKAPQKTRSKTPQASNFDADTAGTPTKDVFARILKNRGLHNVDKDIVSVEEIFRLQKMDKVRADEKRFLA